MAESAQITLQELAGLRRVTRGLAEFLEPQLRDTVEFLSPLLRPKRVLGKFVSGGTLESAPKETEAFTRIEKSYAEVYRPLGLHPKVPNPLPSIRSRIEIHPWEETWTPPGGNAAIQVISPLCWILSYQGTCRVGRLREMLGGSRERDLDAIRGFALNAAVLGLLIEQTPGFAKLMRALRFRVEARPLTECPALLIPVVRSEIESVRPPGQVMIDATELAGMSTFSEVVDPSKVERLSDPLAQKLNALLDEHRTHASKPAAATDED